MIRAPRQVAIRAVRRLGPLAWIAGLAAAYAGLSFALDRLTGHAGLLMPTGPPPLWALALGALTITARLVLLFVAPVLVGYWLARMLMGKPMEPSATARSSDTARGAGREPPSKP